MAIPNIPEIDTVLGSFQLTSPENAEGYRSVEITMEASAFYGEVPLKSKAVRLWYRPSEKIQFESVLKRIGEELKKAGHRSEESVLLNFLGAATFSVRERLSITLLNQVLNTIVSVRVHQILLLPLKPSPGQIQTFHLGPYQIGVLDDEWFELKCHRAKANYFKINRQRVLGRMAIIRLLTDVRVINWPEVFLAFHHDLDRTKDFAFYVDGYFLDLNKIMLSEFFADLLAEQHLLIAMGAPYLDERIIQKVLGYELVGIFQGLTAAGIEQGWVVGTGTGVRVVEFAGMDKRVPETVAQLKKKFGFDRYLSKNPFHGILRTYALFLSKAKRHILDGRPDEGFLHNIIALDLCFGEKDQTTRNVARRVALLIHNAQGESYDRIRERVEYLYELRSRYVHEGAIVPPQVMMETETICQQVLICLLRSQVRAEKNPILLQDWKKKMDYTAAAIEANSENHLDGDHWASLGVETVPS